MSIALIIAFIFYGTIGSAICTVVFRKIGRPGFGPVGDFVVQLIVWAIFVVFWPAIVLYWAVSFVADTCLR